MLVCRECSLERTLSPARVTPMARTSLTKEDTVTRFLMDSATAPTCPNKGDRLRKAAVHNSLNRAVSMELSGFFKDAASSTPSRSRPSRSLPSSRFPMSEVSLFLHETTFSEPRGSSSTLLSSVNEHPSRPAPRHLVPIVSAPSPYSERLSPVVAKPTVPLPDSRTANHVGGLRPRYSTIPAKLYFADQTDDEDQSMDSEDTDVDEYATTLPSFGASRVKRELSLASNFSETTYAPKSEHEMDMGTVCEPSETSSNISDCDVMDVVEETDEEVQEVDSHLDQEVEESMEESKDYVEDVDYAPSDYFDQALGMMTGTAISAISGEDVIFETFGTAYGDDADDIDDLRTVRSPSVQPSETDVEGMRRVRSPSVQPCETDTEEADEVLPTFSRTLGRTISLVSESSRNNSPVPESHEKRLERNLARWPSLNTFAPSLVPVAPPFDAFTPSLYPGIPFNAIFASSQAYVAPPRAAIPATPERPLEKTSSFSHLARGGITPEMLKSFMTRNSRLPTIVEASSSSTSPA